jgi:hypothetical protein
VAQTKQNSVWTTIGPTHVEKQRRHITDLFLLVLILDAVFPFHFLCSQTQFQEDFCFRCVPYRSRPAIMADLGEDLELFEIFPRSPDTEIWYDARDVQAAPDDTQQSDDNVSNTSTTPDPDPVISEDSSRSASAISHLCQRAVVFGEDTTMADILTFLGFPLVILGAWAAVQAIRMAQWTQWKDSFEWCENDGSQSSSLRSRRTTTLIHSAAQLDISRMHFSSR